MKIEPLHGLLIQAAYFGIDQGSAFVNSADQNLTDKRYFSATG
jgi:hypothetical protein